MSIDENGKAQVLLRFVRDEEGREKVLPDVLGTYEADEWPPPQQLLMLQATPRGPLGALIGWETAGYYGVPGDKTLEECQVMLQQIVDHTHEASSSDSDEMRFRAFIFERQSCSKLDPTDPELTHVVPGAEYRLTTEITESENARA